MQHSSVRDVGIAVQPDHGLPGIHGGGRFGQAVEHEMGAPGEQDGVLRAGRLALGSVGHHERRKARAPDRLADGAPLAGDREVGPSATGGSDRVQQVDQLAAGVVAVGARAVRREVLDQGRRRSGRAEAGQRCVDERVEQAGKAVGAVVLPRLDEPLEGSTDQPIVGHGSQGEGPVPAAHRQRPERSEPVC